VEFQPLRLGLGLGLGLIIPTFSANLVLRVIWQCEIFGMTPAAALDWHEVTSVNPNNRCGQPLSVISAENLWSGKAILSVNTPTLSGPDVYSSSSVELMRCKRVLTNTAVSGSSQCQRLQQVLHLQSRRLHCDHNEFVASWRVRLAESCFGFSEKLRSMIFRVNPKLVSR